MDFADNKKEFGKEINLTEEDKLYILDRDNEICQYCGGPGKTVHHITPLSNKKHKLKEELCTLCSRCHYNIHSQGWKKFKGFLMERVQINEERRKKQFRY